MSIDFGVDFEKKLFPLVGRDALHEYSRWTPFVNFVTDGDECLGAPSNSSSFSPFWWGSLLEEVGEQRCSLVGMIECYHGDVGG